jgi:hypothetical protein
MHVRVVSQAFPYKKCKVGARYKFKVFELLVFFGKFKKAEGRREKFTNSSPLSLLSPPSPLSPGLIGIVTCDRSFDHFVVF